MRRCVEICRESESERVDPARAPCWHRQACVAAPPRQPSSALTMAWDRKTPPSSTAGWPYGARRRGRVFERTTDAVDRRSPPCAAPEAVEMMKACEELRRHRFQSAFEGSTRRRLYGGRDRCLSRRRSRKPELFPSSDKGLSGGGGYPLLLYATSVREPVIAIGTISPEEFADTINWDDENLRKALGALRGCSNSRQLSLPTPDRALRGTAINRPVDRIPRPAGSRIAVGLYIQAEKSTGGAPVAAPGIPRRRRCL